jgi:2',3'-cyclic-nucleotide 2'-phosphodiesterase (5'-nucleotidase family)
MTEQATERLTILHTNDIHARLVGLAQVATLVSELRTATPNRVLYLDAGDIEDTSHRLSSLTKGTAMHRLLSAAGCEGAAIGNGGLLRYGPTMLERYAAAATYPLWLANLRSADGSVIPGVQPSSIMELPGLRLGVIGVTDPFDTYSRFFGLTALDIVGVVKELALELRAGGAEFILVLSHLGWEHEKRETFDDQQLALALQSEIDLIIGAHTHHLLPHGERIGRVWVAQAGQHAEYLGRVELARGASGWDVANIETLEVSESIQPSSIVLETQQRIEAELEMWLNEPVAVLSDAFSHADDAECATGNLIADALRDFWNAEIGLALTSTGSHASLEAGGLTRGALLGVTPSTANPGFTALTGAQVAQMLEAGLDVERARQRPKSLRGAAQGLMHVSGMTRRDGRWYVGAVPLEQNRSYRVGSSDAELEEDFGYVRADWNLKVEYDTSVVMGDVLEAYLKRVGVVTPETGRLG